MAGSTVLEKTQHQAALLDGDVLYEVVNGQKVELPPMSALASDIASELLSHLRAYARDKNLGRAFMEMLFFLAVLACQRRPDVAYVSFDRWPRDRRVPDEEGWDVVPELAAEVISPSNTAEGVLTKLREYFQAGVLRVWV